jgi:hypothetical protein
MIEVHNLEIGEIYNVSHSRKGSFVIGITDINGEWISGVILEGRARYISFENTRMVDAGATGMPITIRAKLCYFTEFDGFEESPFREADDDE